MNTEFELLADRSGHSTHLDLCHAAIHKQLDAVDKAAVIGSEKDNGFGDLVGRADSSQWNTFSLALHKFFQLLFTESEEIVTRSRNETRADRIHSNLAVGSVLHLLKDNQIE